MGPLVEFHQSPKGLWVQPVQALDKHQLNRLVSNLVQGACEVMVVDDERPVPRANNGRKTMLIEHGSPGKVREPLPLGALVSHFEISDAALRRGEVTHGGADQRVVFYSHRLWFGLSTVVTMVLIDRTLQQANCNPVALGIRVLVGCQAHSCLNLLTFYGAIAARF
jgi:hypothetical protein